ncbi:MAG: acyl-CoA thioesterase [Bacteroidales bacterium]|nr:acyl-CoA thioesterase [Bacteroidales bacterium]
MNQTIDLCKQFAFENVDVVRDYECDIQGIVNNANYQHYLEHSRHLFIASRGITFSQLHDDGIDVVVARFSIAYKKPLHPGEEYVCRLIAERNGLRYIFHQAIFSKVDMKICVTAQVDCVALVEGRLKAVPRLNALLTE